MTHWGILLYNDKIPTLVDSRNDTAGTPPPPPERPNSFDFMQFLGKFGKIICWRPPWGVDAPYPREEILDPPLSNLNGSRNMSNYC